MLYGECECFVTHMLYVGVLYVSCGNSQCYFLYTSIGSNIRLRTFGCVIMCGAVLYVV